MSKRTIVMSSILAAILMATVLTGTVLARGPRDPEGTSVELRGNATAFEDRGFVDADGDGEPDCEDFVDEDGDGVCDNSDGVGSRFAYGDGTQMLDGSGHAYGFVDEDNDGINDRAGKGRYAQGDGMPDFDGDNFVDADGDGLCDNCDGDCTPGTGENAQRLGGGRGGRSDR